MEWFQAADIVEKHTVRISTPSGSGTGFFVFRSSKMCGIATAAHVIDHAHLWEQPIRITHDASGMNVLLRPPDRAVLLDEDADTAAILFDSGILGLPEKPMQLIEEGKVMKVGNELAWWGYPGLARDTLCLFSGRISAYLKDGNGYLVDGVAINGVSGGPTVWTLTSYEKHEPELVGVVSAYIPNRATGEVLPGLAVVRDVKHFQTMIKNFKNLEDAQQKQTPESAVSTNAKL